MRKLLLFIRYGRWFDTDYYYCQVKHSYLRSLEAHHKLLILEGWERDTDVVAGFDYYYCWYRKKNKGEHKGRINIRSYECDLFY